MNNCIENIGYVAAWDAEVGQAPIACVICGVPVVLFRKLDGKVVALRDVCPHRLRSQNAEFDDDGDILEAQQRSMMANSDLKRRAYTIDAGGVRARQINERKRKEARAA